MFRVSLINVSPDLRSAQPDLGTRDAGQRSETELTDLLRAFRDLDPVQNHDAEPQVIIESPRGRSIIRTNHGKLYLYTGRDAATEFIELPPQAIVAELSRDGSGSAAQRDPAPARPRRSGWLAIALLVAAIGLNAYTFSSLYSTNASSMGDGAAVNDARDATALKLSARGRYQTGTDDGDRVIEITPDDRVRFLRLTEKGERLEAEDTYEPARRQGKVCLLTKSSGLIEVGNIDTLAYYGDVYRRK